MRPYPRAVGALQLDLVGDNGVVHHSVERDLEGVSGADGWSVYPPVRLQQRLHQDRSGRVSVTRSLTPPDLLIGATRREHLAGTSRCAGFDPDVVRFHRLVIAEAQRQRHAPRRGIDTGDFISKLLHTY
jgi:hypothetical protein